MEKRVVSKERVVSVVAKECQRRRGRARGGESIVILLLSKFQSPLLRRNNNE